MNDTPGAKAGCLAEMSCRAKLGRASEDTRQQVGDVRFLPNLRALLRICPKISPPIAFAWGVLGSAIGGVPFLLTHPVVFRSS